MQFRNKLMQRQKLIIIAGGWVAVALLCVFLFSPPSQPELPTIANVPHAAPVAPVAQTPVISPVAAPAQSLAAAPKRVEEDRPRNLIALLKSGVELDDPIRKARAVKGEKLSGQAYQDFWTLFRRNHSRGVLSSALNVKGTRFQIVTDTPDGSGCNYFYDDKGRYLISACGSDEVSWRWRKTDRIASARSASRKISSK